MVELRVLGVIDLRRDGREIAAVLTQPRDLALLLYLDVARPHRFHRGDGLLEMLWPEVDPSISKPALAEAIERIRRELGESAIATRGDDVMLDTMLIRSDVRVLESAIANTDHMRVVQLYQGTLADGFTLKGAPEFERWLDEERQRIRNEVASSAWTLAERARDNGKLDDATAFARSAASLTRDDEESIRRLMTFLEDSGDHEGALRAYDEFAIWLSGEVDAVPDPDTDALHEKLMHPETVEADPVQAPPSPPIATAAPPKKEEKKTPLWLPWAAVGVAAAALLLLFASVLSR